MRRPEGARGVRVRSVAAVLAGSLATMTSSQAQTDYVRPYVDTVMTYSDNIGADSSNEKADFSLEVAPGIAIRRDSGRLKGNLNGRLRNIAYLSESDRNDSFLSLDAHGQFEAIERLLFIDMDAAVSRNNRSVLFGREQGDPRDTSEANETQMFGIGPRLQFRLGTETKGSVAYMHRWLSGQGALRDRQEGVLSAQMADPTYFGRLGWGVDYYRVDSTAGRAGGTGASTRETARATLYAKLSSQLRLRGIVGRERNDYELGSEDRGTIAGGGFDWNPTPRTTISATSEKRIFGRGHDVRFSHRRPRSVWNLSYVKDISSTLDLVGVDMFQDQRFLGVYDHPSLAGVDPELREAFARQVYLANGGPAVQYSNNYYLTRDLAAGVTLLGARNVLSFTVKQSERERLGAAAIVTTRGDDLSRFDDVKTRSASVALSHRLSPVATANATVTRSHSKGKGVVEDVDTRRTSLNLGVTKVLGPNTRGALNFTHQRADGGSDFTENAVIATISISF